MNKMSINSKRMRAHLLTIGQVGRKSSLNTTRVNTKLGQVRNLPMHRSYYDEVKLNTPF